MREKEFALFYPTKNVNANFFSNPSPRILCHVCCGPCSIFPLKTLLGENVEVWGFFYNPNIHPYAEFKRRLEATKTLSALLSVKMLYNEEYRPVEFTREMKASVGGVKYPPYKERCAYCYSTRLEATAKAAKEGGFDGFTTSLLYSRYQMHDEIKKAGEELAGRYGVAFYYADFRAGWQAGIDESKAMGLYRQKYCGCIYSKIERYAKKRG